MKLQHTSTFPSHHSSLANTTTTNIIMMLKSTLLAATLVALAQAQTPAWFFTNGNFGGSQLNAGSNLGACINVPANFNDQISSAVVARGFRCYIYANANCALSLFATLNAGDHYTIPAYINDQTSSYKCERA
jgi:hypothetical protein